MVEQGVATGAQRGCFPAVSASALARAERACREERRSRESESTARVQSCLCSPSDRPRTAGGSLRAEPLKWPGQGWSETPAAGRGAFQAEETDSAGLQVGGRRGTAASLPPGGRRGTSLPAVQEPPCCSSPLQLLLDSLPPATHHHPAAFTPQETEGDSTCKTETKIVENQTYDERLEINDSEEVASIYTTTPRYRGLARSAHLPNKTMADNSSDEYEEENNKEKKKTLQLTPQQGFSENDDDDDDSSETDSDEDDDDEEHGAPLEGAYDPADYEHLPVSAEVKELFQYISRYTPQLIDLDHKLKPFIPDFIPAVGDIDAFLKVPRPDGKPDNLGLLVLDEPSTKQSDPTVLSLWLTENSKQHNITQHMKVKSLEDAEKNPKAIDTWIESISELHRSKPPATVHYTRPMPDIDTLMQEWSPEFEELLGKVSLPTAEIDCSLAAYIDMICAILDIPIYKSRIQSLHLLFSLYSEFKNSQHFKALAEGKKAFTPPSKPTSQAGDAETITFS